MDEEVNQDKNGEADGMNLEVDSEDEVMQVMDTQTHTHRCKFILCPCTELDRQIRG